MVMQPEAATIPVIGTIQSPAPDFTLSIPYDNLQEKTVLITGGASGMGAGIAHRAAQHGATVIIGDINEAQGVQTVAALRKVAGNERQHFVHLDVTKWESQVAFFKAARALSPHGGIDCVIANAGVSISSESERIELFVPRYPSLENPSPPSMRTLKVDLEGVIYTSTLALSYLAENPGSQKCSLDSANTDRDRHLLLVSSLAGIGAFPAASIYTAAKHGVVGLFRALQVSAPIMHGVRVNMVCPQYVETPIYGAKAMGSLIGMPRTEIDDVIEAFMRLMADTHIIGRALLVGTRGSPEQIQAAGLGNTPGHDTKGSIWDVYGHDLEQTDLLLRRTIALLNLASQARGWMALLGDFLRFFLAVLASGWRIFSGLLRRR